MRPLDGVRVLDLTRLLPGAYATLLLADLGADVVKIEDPRGGDPARAMPPRTDGTSVYFTVLNRNKKSVALDLRSPAAASVLDRLLPQFDVVVESFRPQTARRLGVDAATLRGRYPRLIHASVSGFGQTGPYAERAAHDINYEAISGLLSVTHAEGEMPRVPRTLVGDVGAAMNGAAGILAALYQRERTGAGAAVDVSIHESALIWLLFPGARQLVAGVEPGAKDLPIYGTHAFYNVYQTGDGRYVALGALEPKFWRAFCERVGRADLIPLHDAGGELQVDALRDVRALFATRSRAEWLALFADIDVCLAPVNTVAEALADPHVQQRGAVTATDHATYITFPIVVTERTTPDGWDDARHGRVEPARPLGADTDQVLASAGLSTDELLSLRQAAVIA